MRYKDCMPSLTAAAYERHVMDSMDVIATIPGKPWPKGPVTAVLQGLATVPRPQGLIVAGDLTEAGTATQWKRFDAL